MYSYRLHALGVTCFDNDSCCSGFVDTLARIFSTMSTPVDSPFEKLLFFLQRLDDTKIWYKLDHVRDAIMVTVTVPGERWEVEFFENGLIEVERFVSTGTIENEDMIDQLFVRFGDN